MIVLEKVFYNKIRQSFRLPGRTRLFKYYALRNSQIPAPLGEFLSNLASSGIYESELKWSSLLCVIFVTVCSSEFPSFSISDWEKSCYVTLCNFLLSFSECLLPCYLRQNLKSWKLYSRHGNTLSWYKSVLSPYMFLVNPSICHFSVTTLDGHWTGIFTNTCKLWVRINLS